MENASKALLIAASVLIVILLIAIGMKVLNSTSGTTDAVEGNMNATEIAMFNNKFMQYVGNNRTTNDVKALLNLIIAHNSTNSRKIKVELYIEDCGSGMPSLRNTENVREIGNILPYISQYYPTFDGRIYILVSGGYDVDRREWRNGYNSDGFIEKIYINNSPG